MFPCSSLRMAEQTDLDCSATVFHPWGCDVDMDVLSVLPASTECRGKPVRAKRRLSCSVDTRGVRSSAHWLCLRDGSFADEVRRPRQNQCTFYNPIRAKTETVTDATQDTDTPRQVHEQNKTKQKPKTKCTGDWKHGRVKQTLFHSDT